MQHHSVLLFESITALNIKNNGIYIDCTFGRGGHSRAILAQLGEKGRLFAIDQDPEAVQVGQTLQQHDKRFCMIHSAFEQLSDYVTQYDLMGKVDGILFDLGVSSPQLDNAERGFSFMREGMLDMRMNPTTGISIKDWLMEVKEKELADILKTYGEERFAKRIARAIVNQRQEQPIETTAQLAEIIKTAHPKWEKDKHPATRSFQALRIFINRELEQLQHILPQTLDFLAPQGRLAVISFHSLEDRIVKRFIRDCYKGDDFPPDMPVTVDMLKPTLKPVGKAIVPNEEEVNNNPRARSAVLRIAERLA